MTHFVDILGKLSSSAQLLRATINLCYWYNKKSKTVKMMEHRVAEVFQIFCEGHFCLRRKAANFCHPGASLITQGDLLLVFGQSPSTAADEFLFQEATK